MKTFIKDILIFAAGAATGAGVMYYFNKKKWDQYEIVTEDVPEENKIDIPVKEVQVAPDSPIKTAFLGVSQAQKQENVIKYTEPENEQPLVECEDTPEKYVRMYDGTLKNVNVSEEEPDVYVSRTREICYETNFSSMNAPYEITEEEYNDVNNGYELLVLGFTRDGVLSDDADYPVNAFEAERLIGSDNYEKLALRFQEYPNAMYIRNDECGAMFCIEPYNIEFYTLTGRRLEDYGTMDKFGNKMEESN